MSPEQKEQRDDGELAPRPQPFRPREEAVPPPARRVTDVAIMRYEHVYEVDPELMSRTPQQRFPNWDTLRIAHSREDHLEWMRRHWSAKTVSGQAILDRLGD